MTNSIVRLEKEFSGHKAVFQIAISTFDEILSTEYTPPLGHNAAFAHILKRAKNDIVDKTNKHPFKDNVLACVHVNVCDKKLTLVVAKLLSDVEDREINAFVKLGLSNVKCLKMVVYTNIINLSGDFTNIKVIDGEMFYKGMTRVTLDNDHPANFDIDAILYYVDPIVQQYVTRINPY